MGEQAETNFLNRFEKSRDPDFPFLYWVEDPSEIKEIIEKITRGSFGVEVGFGMEPTRVTMIDPKINWILADPSRGPDESDKTTFREAKRDTHVFWEGVPALEEGRAIFALKTEIGEDVVKKAKVIVSRNPDYRFSSVQNTINVLPRIDELSSGQKLVIIVDDEHIRELPLFREFLENYGYDPSLLVENKDPKKMLSITFDSRAKQFVFDFTKR